MTVVLTGLQVATAAAFMGAAFLAVLDRLRGERRSGYLAAALASLGLVALGTPVAPLVGHPLVERSVLIALFLLSAAAMLLYRNSIVRLPLWGMSVAAIGLGGAAALAYVAGLPAAGSSPNALQGAATDILIVVWCVCVLEPAYRLSSVSANLPLMQRAQLRFIASGYLILAVVVALEVLVAERAADTRISVGLQALVLVCTPLFSVGFMAPRRLRRRWRQQEQEHLIRATHDLLLFSPDRAALAHRALTWAVRLVGGSGGLVADTGDEIVAIEGMSEAEARAVVASKQVRESTSSIVRIGPRGQMAIVERLPLDAGPGLLVVIASPLAPSPGRDEAEWLRAYAASVTIALDRVRVSEMSAQTASEMRHARDLAEEASQAKSEFLSRMSHELRTPLTAMIGFSELLLLEELSEAQKRHVRTILKAGDHLLALINDILDISRIEEGRLTLSPEPVAVAGVVHEAVELVRPMAAEREVRLDVTAVPAELTVQADRQRLKQVLLNLVTNSVKYNRPQGRVEITASRVENGRGRIAVADTGIGLREEDLGRLFAPFERLSAATSGVEGTGLGLTLSKSLVEAMGGSIGVKSQPGSGSTFWVELPPAAPEPLALQLDGSDEEGGEARQPAGVVLYVEDNLSNVGLVEGILARRPGLRLLTAMQGRIALELARQNRPDLILLDVHLPDMDGAEVLRRLTADPNTAGIPVVVLSADATAHQRHRLLGLGAAEYLTKPIRVGVLLRTLDRRVPQHATGGSHRPALPSSVPGRADRAE
jgi:signal transduction histidine kinase/CheY-like chemotaxis protein